MLEILIKDLDRALNTGCNEFMTKYGTSKIVAHRGNHLDFSENTLEAFETCKSWGIEFDVRWTKDFVPIVHHDETLERVFGIKTKISDLSFAQLRAEAPKVPTLEEVLAIRKPDGSVFHNMIEVKVDHGLHHPQGLENLKNILKKFGPVDDFHLLSLNTQVFDCLPFLPKTSFLPVAELNILQMSQYALKNNCAGMGGHYLLCPTFLIGWHKKKGQHFATGHINSDFWLRRELNRNVDWIFSNAVNKLTAS